MKKNVWAMTSIDLKNIHHRSSCLTHETASKSVDALPRYKLAHLAHFQASASTTHPNGIEYISVHMDIPDLQRVRTGMSEKPHRRSCVIRPPIQITEGSLWPYDQLFYPPCGIRFPIELVQGIQSKMKIRPIQIIQSPPSPLWSAVVCSLC
jgi:hypothetical protein